MARNYKKVSERPGELGKLIDKVNLLPPGFQLHNLTFVLEEQRQFLREQSGDNNAIPSITEALKVCLKDTPEEFRLHIEYETLERGDPFGVAKPHMVDIYNVQRMAGIYSEYFELRISMFRLLERLETERQMMRDAEVRRQLKEGSITLQYFTLGNWDSYPLSISTVINRRNGKLEITGLASLIGTFDDTRLRKCKICSRIFWAKQLNSETCGKKKCADDLGNKKRSAEARAQKEKLNNHFQSRVKKYGTV